MQTLWIGVREDEVMCGSESGRECVERMRRGTLFAIGNGMHLQAVRADNGTVLGFGTIVHQSEAGTMQVDTLELALPRSRTLRGMHSRSITGQYGITTYVEDVSGNVWP